MYYQLPNYQSTDIKMERTKPTKENYIKRLERHVFIPKFNKYHIIASNSSSGQERCGIRHPRLIDPHLIHLEKNIYEPGYKEFPMNSIWKVLQKLRTIRGYRKVVLEDLFEPLDPRATGKLSSHVFKAALMGNIDYQPILTKLDIEQIAYYYTDKDTDCVDYRSFIDFVNQPEPKGIDCTRVEIDTALTPRYHGTSANNVELETLQSVLEYIAKVLLYKKLHIDAYLREDESVMKSRFISMTHLKKIFIHIGIFLDDDQFSMICKWFGRNGIQIDACVFLTHLNNAITRVCKSGSYDPKKMAKKVGKRYINTCFPKIIHPDVNADEIHDFFQQGKSTHGSQERWFERCEDFTDLITRLQRSIHINQIIARPRFQQFDNLNSGRITVPQFTRALDLCEINTNGKTRIFISPLEMQKLIEVYSESYEPGYVMWRLFVNDIESGNCIRDLHRKPSANVSDHEPMGPRKEVLDLECKYSRRKEMTLIEHRRAERILEYVRQQLRDCELYQFFRAFDKENRRHITRNQFREIMRISNVLLREQDVYDLELYFVDYYGFCYMFFLQVFGIITPPPRLVPTEDINKYRKVASTSGYAPYEAEGTTGVEVLTKIRHTVFQRSLRLKYFFETFDRFNTGVMDENTFLRALSSAHNWAFTYSEYKKLMAMFRRPLAENDIEYKKFLSALDELYTQPCLEQSPLVKPVPYQGWKDHVQELTLKERTELGKAIHKIVHKGLCLDHLVAFKDMDIYHCSTIPYDKYIQGMETAGVRKYLSLREQKLIFKAFTRPVYHRTEFDYTRFLKACHHVCPMPVVYL